jgi:hypothetical protein
MCVVDMNISFGVYLVEIRNNIFVFDMLVSFSSSFRRG